jgi:hypothetical protein
MRGLKVSGVVGFCLVTLTVFALAPTRKPGLWEATSAMTWQQSPMPGMPAAMPGRTTQVCVTQEMIEKYGGNIPETRGNCQLSNVVMKPSGMTADLVCTGQMNGKATIATTWTDEEHASSTVHFTGEMSMGPGGAKPVEWTVKASSVFKSADCGSVKPIAMPAK